VPIRKLAPEKKRKRTNPILVALLVVIIFGALGAGGYFGYQYWSEHKKAAENAAAAGQPKPSEFASGAAGIPKTLEELNHWYQDPPADQNAATFFQQGFDALQVADADRTASALPLIGKAATPLPAAPLSAAMKSTLRTFLEKNQPAVDLFERGAQCSGSRYPVDLTKGFETQLPHLVKVRQAAQISDLYALWQADLRRGTNAGQGVLLALAAAKSLDAEPLTISQLVRVAGQGFAVDALEQTVNRVALPPETLTQLQSAFDHAAEHEAAGTAFDRALVAERVTDGVLFDLGPEKLRESIARMTGDTNEMTSVMKQVSEKMTANFKDQRKFVEDSLDQVLAARKDPLPGRLKADELMTSRANEAKTKEYFIASMVLPALGKVTSKEAGSLARLRLAQTAVALERFRAANTNRYPDALTELAPKFLAAVPNDPFDGQPLRYQKAGAGGYLLHSIGVDLKDDNGVRKVGADDLSFAVVRPPRP
jgi:type II secretory pathway pseudopilin PulG